MSAVSIGLTHFSAQLQWMLAFQTVLRFALIAIGIALLASAFAIGARLTRDTEGLV
jgi:hypothetical protein